MAKHPAWRAYENQIAQSLRAKAVPTATISFDEAGRQKLPGILSGTKRQIDVIVRGEFAGLPGEYLMIVDCKCIERKIDVLKVESFIGLVQDVAAALGIIVTTKGFSKAAERRAKAVGGISIDVVPLDELAVWLPRRPVVAHTAGARCATLAYWDDDEIRTELVDSELARRLLDRTVMTERA